VAGGQSMVASNSRLVGSRERNNLTAILNDCANEACAARGESRWRGGPRPALASKSHGRFLLWHGATGMSNSAERRWSRPAGAAGTELERPAFFALEAEGNGRAKPNMGTDPARVGDARPERLARAFGQGALEIRRDLRRARAFPRRRELHSLGRDAEGAEHCQRRDSELNPVRRSMRSAPQESGSVLRAATADHRRHLSRETLLFRALVGAP